MKRSVFDSCAERSIYATENDTATPLTLSPLSCTVCPEVLYYNLNIISFVC